MSATPELLAKSISHGGELSLLAHTQHVVAVAEAAALAVLDALEVATRPVSRAEATEALQFAVAHCAGKRKNWSPWQGLLQVADHFASATWGHGGNGSQNTSIVPGGIEMPKAISEAMRPRATLAAQRKRYLF